VLDGGFKTGLGIGMDGLRRATGNMEYKWCVEGPLLIVVGVSLVVVWVHSVFFIFLLGPSEVS